MWVPGRAWPRHARRRRRRHRPRDGACAGSTAGRAEGAAARSSAPSTRPPGSVLPQPVLDLGVRDVDLPLIGADVRAAASWRSPTTTPSTGPACASATSRATSPTSPWSRASGPDARTGLPRAAGARSAEAYRRSVRRWRTASPRPCPWRRGCSSRADLPEVLDDADGGDRRTSRAAVAPFARATQAMSLLLLVAVLRPVGAQPHGGELDPDRMGPRPAAAGRPRRRSRCCRGRRRRAARRRTGAWPESLLAGPPGRLGVRELPSRRPRPPACWPRCWVLGAAAAWPWRAALQQEREAARGPRHQPVAGAVGPWCRVAVGVVGAAVLTLDVDQRATSPLAAVFPLAIGAGVAVVVMWIAAMLPGLRPRGGRDPGHVAGPASVRRLDDHRGHRRPRHRPDRPRLRTRRARRGRRRRGGQGSRADRGTDPGRRRRAAGRHAAGPGHPGGRPGRGRGLPRGESSCRPTFGEKPLLMADPDALASVVDWGAPSTTPGRGGPGRAGRGRDPEDPVPVVLAGTTDARRGDRLTLHLQQLHRRRRRRRGRGRGLPRVGVRGRRGDRRWHPPGPLVAALPARSPPSTPYDRTVGAGVFSAAIWSSGSAAASSNGCATSASRARRSTLLERAARTTRLLAADWAVGYLAAARARRGVPRGRHRAPARAAAAGARPCPRRAAAPHGLELARADGVTDRRARGDHRPGRPRRGGWRPLALVLGPTVVETSAAAATAGASRRVRRRRSPGGWPRGCSWRWLPVRRWRPAAAGDAPGRCCVTSADEGPWSPRATAWCGCSAPGPTRRPPSAASTSRCTVGCSPSSPARPAAGRPACSGCWPRRTVRRPGGSTCSASRPAARRCVGCEPCVAAG